MSRKVIVIISSAFIQITFGLKEYTLRDYRRIYIAPEAYTYKGKGYLLSGDVNKRTKLVSLSWPCVKNGFEIPDDAMNVAIHEFGHCLSMENFSYPDIGNFFHKRFWMNWLEHAQAKMKVIRARRNKVIRRYGGSDVMEMFAVSLETFFEQPELFKEHLPKMYYSLSKMLNQDPIKKDNPVLGRRGRPYF